MCGNGFIRLCKYATDRGDLNGCRDANYCDKDHKICRGLFCKDVSPIKKTTKKADNDQTTRVPIHERMADMSKSRANSMNQRFFNQMFKHVYDSLYVCPTCKSAFLSGRKRKYCSYGCQVSKAHSDYNKKRRSHQNIKPREQRNREYMEALNKEKLKYAIYISEGFSLRKIAKLEGISHEWVKQILIKLDLYGTYMIGKHK